MGDNEISKPGLILRSLDLVISEKVVLILGVFSSPPSLLKSKIEGEAKKKKHCAQVGMKDHERMSRSEPGPAFSGLNWPLFSY